MNTDSDPVSTTKHSEPHGEYSSRLAAQRAESERLGRFSTRLSFARMIVFLLAAAAGWLGFTAGGAALLLVVPPAAVFIALLGVHERAIRGRRRAERAAVFYEQGIARLEERWAGQGSQGLEFLDAKHLYARDLDLFGRGSLFELISGARTRAGESRLARWLLEPAPPEVIRARQEAVAELRPRLQLREELAVLGGEVRSGVRGEELTQWGEAPRVLEGTGAQIAAGALALAALFSLAAWELLDWGMGPFVGLVAIELVFTRVFRARLHRVYEHLDRAARDLSLLSEILERLEGETFGAERLKHLRSELETRGLPASREIARLKRLVGILADARHNMLFAPIALVLMLPLQLAHGVERWRARVGQRLGPWIEAVGEIEALGSLAAYGYEHPEDVFPEIVEGEGLFEAEGLAHPLIGEGRAVRNDVRLKGELRLLVLSGSNMSGKSTFLRTIGVAALLAQAGAPVRAKKLRLSPLSVGASIQTVDSLQEGASRFYAEITRIKDIIGLCEGERTALFLLDEIMGGTNPKDRRIGAESVMRQLLKRRAIGVITTHDLELTEVAERLAPAAENAHFEDQLVEGEIRFDYKLRDGVVERGNALALMRSVGLEV